MPTQRPTGAVPLNLNFFHEKSAFLQIECLNSVDCFHIDRYILAQSMTIACRRLSYDVDVRIGEETVKKLH